MPKKDPKQVAADALKQAKDTLSGAIGNRQLIYWIEHPTLFAQHLPLQDLQSFYGHICCFVKCSESKKAKTQFKKHNAKWQLQLKSKEESETAAAKEKEKEKALALFKKLIKCHKDAIAQLEKNEGISPDCIFNILQSNVAFFQAMLCSSPESFVGCVRAASMVLGPEGFRAYLGWVEKSLDLSHREKIKDIQLWDHILSVALLDGITPHHPIQSIVRYLSEERRADYYLNPQCTARLNQATEKFLGVAFQIPQPSPLPTIPFITLPHITPLGDAMIMPQLTQEPPQSSTSLGNSPYILSLSVGRKQPGPSLDYCD